MALAQFPKAVPLPPVPELTELTGEERDVWNWMTVKGTTFDSHLINLTPRLARLLLSRVAENRTVRPAVVQRYQRQIDHKQWLLTHQGIALSTRYEMIDGQHRCMAVIASGVTIEVLAVRGVSQDAMIVLDSGTSRTDAEAIRFSDVNLRDLDTTETQAAKRMMRGRRAQSREDLRAFILLHRDVIRTICAALLKKPDGTKNRVPNITTADVIAVLARAMYNGERDVVVAAARFLATGEAGSDGRAQPLLMLREWLLSATPKQLKQRYGKTERAVQAYINGNKVGPRWPEAHDELFPLPEERD